MFNSPGRANLVIDGQFGSTGKGLICGYLALQSPPDIAVSCASANAGHTCITPDNGAASGRKIVANHLPISGILTPSAQIYLGAGAILDPKILMKEVFEYLDDEDRLAIHPRACIIEAIDVQAGQHPDSQSTKIAGTQHGVSQALARKVLRKATLAADCPELKKFIKVIDLNQKMEAGASVMLEVAQGLGLGLNSGYAYPYCTSREVSVSAALSDAQIHPSFLGNVMMTMRTYPIRVGNIYGEGRMKGWSGPFYPDSVETSWEDIGVPIEKTTVTQRVRRVATFSLEQYSASLASIRPTHIFLNFMNYLKFGPNGMEQTAVIDRLMALRKPTHLGWGPTTKDIEEI